MMKVSEWLNANPKAFSGRKTLSCVMSKSDPRFRLYVSSCMTKRWFADKCAVAKFLAAEGYDKNAPKNLYAYKCKFCNGWHFSSHKMYAPEKVRKCCFSKSHLVARRLEDRCHLDTFRPDSWGWAKTKKLLDALMASGRNEEKKRKEQLAMSSKLVHEDDFYDYAEWHEWLDDNKDKYVRLDDDTVLCFYDSKLTRSCDQKSKA